MDLIRKNGQDDLVWSFPCRELCVSVTLLLLVCMHRAPLSHAAGCALSGQEHCIPQGWEAMTALRISLRVFTSDRGDLQSEGRKRSNTI